MQDAWRAYLELALGLTEASRKRAQTVAKRLVGQSGATAAQLQGLAEDLLSASLANREALNGMVRAEVERTLTALGLAKAEEVAALSARVSQLERELRLADASAPKPTAAGPGPAAPAATPAGPAGGLVATTPAAKKVAKKAAVAQEAAVPKKSTVGKKAVAKKAAAKEPVATEPTVTESVAKKAAAKKVPAKKAVAKKAARKSAPTTASPDSGPGPA